MTKNNETNDISMQNLAISEVFSTIDEKNEELTKHIDEKNEELIKQTDESIDKIQKYMNDREKNFDEKYRNAFNSTISVCGIFVSMIIFMFSAFVSIIGAKNVPFCWFLAVIICSFLVMIANIFIFRCFNKKGKKSS